MPNKHHNNNHNVINIKIDNTKKTKKRKSKRKNRSHAITPNGAPFSMSSNLLTQLPPTPQLTNRPYYMETNTINPQLQDRPTNTSLDAFHPPPPPPALTHHSDNDDNVSQVSSISHRLSYSKVYPHPPDEYFDHIPLPTPHPMAITEQNVTAGASDLMKTDNEHAYGKKLRAFANKANVYHSTSIKNRADYEHEIGLINRRAKTREKAEAAGTARENYFSAKDIQAQKDHRQQNTTKSTAGLASLLGLSPRETHL